VVAILGNDDVNRVISMPDAIDVIEAAMQRKGEGKFVTPPRHYFASGKGTLTFTIGGDSEEGVVGFRVYGMFPGAEEDDQLVVVYAATGRLRGIVKGDRIGAMRTGAIGGVAIKYSAREDARTLAVIGSGKQARTQLEAAAVVRNLSDVRVYSRSPENRETFASEMSGQLELPIIPVASPEEAISGADIVITATGSRTPVFPADLIEHGQHVTSIRLGATNSELDAKVADCATAIFTDSPEQLRDYPGGSFVADRLDSVTDLADHIASGKPIRNSSDDITLYLSTGLSGTEVVVADLVLQRAG
jgi:ornithine cyclodeaminase/alanine dehydrogenase-like protein (mu-crystallin family)